MRAPQDLHLEKFDRATSIVVVGMVRSLSRVPCAGVGVAFMSVVASPDGLGVGCGGGGGGVLGGVGWVVVGGCCCWVAQVVLGAASVGGVLAVLEGPLPVVGVVAVGVRCVHARVLALWAMVVLGGARGRWVALVAAGWGLRIEGIVDGLLGR